MRVLLVALCVLVLIGTAHAAQLMDPLALTKYVEPLPIPGKMQPEEGNFYRNGAFEKTQKLHPQLPATLVWGYGENASLASYPAKTIEVRRNCPIRVLWTNNLTDALGNPLPHRLSVDSTLHWADPLNLGHTMDPYTGPVPLVTHLHGGEQKAASDGHPEAWFTPGYAIRGPAWVTKGYEYPNRQPATTLFYHDHALGITRLNVYMGLAGFYLIRDGHERSLNLPRGKYEIPLLIQDRLFDTDGQLVYPSDGINPMEHPFWNPEMFGDTIVANGKVWPYLDVEPVKYRFRIANGSDARFYNLSFSNGLGFHQIGTDGGFLRSPVKLYNLLLAPGERADVVVNFCGISPGTRMLLVNNANAPYPLGDAPDPQTVGQIMEIRVKPRTCSDTSSLPCTLNTIPTLKPGPVVRTLTLIELMGENGPLAMFLDGKAWDPAISPISECPRIGDTETWEIINLTADTHPIHLHLVQFQLKNRQVIRKQDYMDEYMRLNPVIPAATTVNPPLAQYLDGVAMPPAQNEKGWKDTVRMNPGEVTRIVIRFSPVDGSPDYPFNATSFPGYAWHCHILSHEDNEMMRPYVLTR